jgi:hypothetical protein
MCVHHKKKQQSAAAVMRHKDRIVADSAAYHREKYTCAEIKKYV